MSKRRSARGTVGHTESPADDLAPVVGRNVRALRTAKSLSLQALAELSGVSRAMLGQMELGQSAPTINVLWKVARALGVPFSALLEAPAPTDVVLLREKDAKRIGATGGRFSTRALFVPSMNPAAELYELKLSPNAEQRAEPHQTGARENLVVAEGTLELKVGGERFELGTGDAIAFRADVAHVYRNPNKVPCVMYLMMTYLSDAAAVRERA